MEIPSQPNQQQLVDFVFDLLKKHGEETIKAQQEETEYERMINKAEYEEER